MSDEKGPIKIKLKAGDTPARILSVLAQLKGREIYCQIMPNFVLITETDFLKKIEEIFSDDLEKLTFITPKEFFVNLLKRKNFKVSPHFPSDLDDAPVTQVRDFLDRVTATKNVVEAAIPEIEPEVEKERPGQKLKAQFTKRKIENLAREKSWRGLVFFLFLGLIMGLSSIFFFISPRAEIVVKPRIDTIETTQNIIIALAGAEIPEDEQNLPVVRSILVETEIAGTETFASTRKEYEVTNARGKVTLYNNDREAKFLVPSRLSTDEGLIFRTQESVTIPGRRDDELGTLVVDVVADPFDAQDRPIGGRGNIENGTDLFFPALREELQALYYAKADQGPLVGGSTLTRYFIAEEDEETARTILEDSFRVRGIERLKLEMTERSQREEKKYVLLDRENLVRAEMQEFDFPQELIGAERSTFEITASYKIGGIVFDQSEVLSHLEKKLRLNQDQRKKIVQIDENAIDYRLLNTDLLEENGWAKISVSIVGVETIDFEADNVFARKWQEAIKREVTGKNLSQARGILVNHPEVEEVLSLSITPFWNQFIPTILDQIDLKIRY